MPTHPSLFSTERVVGTFFFAIATLLAVPATAQGEQPNLNRPYAAWISSYSSAVAQSKLTGRPIMLVFTGSDWCPWCVRLTDEIFHTHKFARWSTQHVIKVEVDFPRNSQLPAELKKQNEQLLRQYGFHVKTYPTILFVDAEGHVLGKTGYVGGGPNKWINTANQFVGPSKDDLVAGLYLPHIRIR